MSLCRITGLPQWASSCLGTLQHFASCLPPLHISPLSREKPCGPARFWLQRWSPLTSCGSVKTITQHIFSCLALACCWDCMTGSQQMLSRWWHAAWACLPCPAAWRCVCLPAMFLGPWAVWPSASHCLWLQVWEQTLLRQSFLQLQLRDSTSGF